MRTRCRVSTPSDIKNGKVRQRSRACPASWPLPYYAEPFQFDYQQRDRGIQSEAKMRVSAKSPDRIAKHGGNPTDPHKTHRHRLPSRRLLPRRQTRLVVGNGEFKSKKPRPGFITVRGRIAERSWASRAWPRLLGIMVGTANARNKERGPSAGPYPVTNEGGGRRQPSFDQRSPRQKGGRRFKQSLIRHPVLPVGFNGKFDRLLPTVNRDALDHAASGAKANAIRLLWLSRAW